MSEYERESILEHPVKLMLYVLGGIALLLASNWCYANYIAPLYIEVNHNEMITDKWTEIQSAFLVFGTKTVYKIEVNNSFVVDVSDQYWYNAVVDVSMYSWTTTELRNEYKNNFIR